MQGGYVHYMFQQISCISAISTMVDPPGLTIVWIAKVPEIQ